MKYCSNVYSVSSYICMCICTCIHQPQEHCIHNQLVKIHTNTNSGFCMTLFFTFLRNFLTFTMHLYYFLLKINPLFILKERRKRRRLVKWQAACRTTAADLKFLSFVYSLPHLEPSRSLPPWQGQSTTGSRASCHFLTKECFFYD